MIECTQLLPSSVSDIFETNDMQEETKISEEENKPASQDMLKKSNVQETENLTVEAQLKPIENIASEKPVASTSETTKIVIENNTTTIHNNISVKNDNLPSDEEEESDNEFDDFKDKRKRESLSDRLPNNSYYKLAPRVFIFPGSEVYYDEDDEDDDLESVKSFGDDNDLTNVSNEIEDNVTIRESSPIPGTSSQSLGLLPLDDVIEPEKKENIE